MEHVFTEGASAGSERICPQKAPVYAGTLVYVDQRMPVHVRQHDSKRVPHAWSCLSTTHSSCVQLQWMERKTPLLVHGCRREE